MPAPLALQSAQRLVLLMVQWLARRMAQMMDLMLAPQLAPQLMVQKKKIQVKARMMVQVKV